MDIYKAVVLSLELSVYVRRSVVDRTLPTVVRKIKNFLTPNYCTSRRISANSSEDLMILLK